MPPSGSLVSSQMGVDTITTHASAPLGTNTLYFFQIVKEPNRPRPKAQKRANITARSLLNPQNIGGGERDRTDDLLLAKQALSQLSYTPDHDSQPPPRKSLVGLVGLEPTTPRLSSVCSNQLSYRPPPLSRGTAKQPIGVSAWHTSGSLERR